MPRATILLPFSLSVAILAAFFLIAAAMPSYGGVDLVSEGRARAVVVTADEPTPTARYAAQELVDHVKLASGVALPVLTESQLPGDRVNRIFIGETKSAARAGIDAARLGREAYVLRASGRDLFVVGREDDEDPLSRSNPNVGTLWGVYDLLVNELGVRWLWPGELGTYVPRAETLRIGAVDRIAAPALAFRELAWSRTRRFLDHRKRLPAADSRLGFDDDVHHAYAEALQVFLRRHRMGGMDAKPPTGHAFRGWWKRYGKEHPEWFALREDGTRGHPDPEALDVPMCVSNEQLQEFIVEQWDGESPIRLGPVDRPGRCTCEKCRAWDGAQPETPPWFAQMVYLTDPRAKGLFPGATADRYARFWKIIRQKAAVRNPDVLVSGSYIYENEFPAPTTGITLGNHFYAEFVQWQDPHLRWFPMPEEAYHWVKQQWLGWKQTGIRMGYRPNYLHDGYVMPHFDTWQSGRFFKFAFENGMEGARFDSLTGQWATQGLRLYLHLRLMSDPKLSIEQIRDEYFSAFGPASNEVERYWDYWEKYANDNVMRFLELFREVGFRYRAYPLRAHEAFPPSCFEPAEAILDKALELANGSGSPECAQRVRFLQAGLEHAQLTTALAAVFDGNNRVADDRVAEGRAALKRLVGFRKANQKMFFSDLYWVTNFWERPRLNLAPLATSLPSPQPVSSRNSENANEQQ